MPRGSSRRKKCAVIVTYREVWHYSHTSKINTQLCQLYFFSLIRVLFEFLFNVTAVEYYADNAENQSLLNVH